MAVDATARDQPLASLSARDLSLVLEHLEPLPVLVPMKVSTVSTMSTNIRHMEDLAVGDNKLIQLTVT